MDISEAYAVLGASPEDDDAALKHRFHQKMKEVHPDVAGTHSHHDAHRVNEAYEMLRKRRETIQQTRYKAKPAPRWKGPVVHNAFAPRDLYSGFSAYGEESIIATGRYLWDPELESFSLLLVSLNRLTSRLMEQVIGKRGSRHPDPGSLYAPLFHLLARQYIHPLYALRKLFSPESTSEEGDIYAFAAVLGAGNTSQSRQVAALNQGDLLYPAMVKNSRLYVNDGHGNPLGYLSFDDDVLYYLIVPILQAKACQVKITVRSSVGKKQRGISRVGITLRLRLKSGIEEIPSPDLNANIQRLLSTLAYS